MGITPFGNEDEYDDTGPTALAGDTALGNVVLSAIKILRHHS